MKEPQFFYMSLFTDHQFPNGPKNSVLEFYLEYVDKEGNPHFSMELSDAVLFQGLSKAISYKDSVLQSWILKNNLTDCFFVHPLVLKKS